MYDECIYCNNIDRNYHDDHIHRKYHDNRICRKYHNNLLNLDGYFYYRRFGIYINDDRKYSMTEYDRYKDMVLRTGKIDLDITDIEYLYYDYETFCILYDFLIGDDNEFWTNRILTEDNVIYEEWRSMILSFNADLVEYICDSKLNMGNKWLTRWLATRKTSV